MMTSGARTGDSALGLLLLFALAGPLTVARTPSL
jgi:hypothetical protein